MRVENLQLKKYEDLYVGEIIDLADPKRLGRVRVQVYGLTDQIPMGSHPWAALQLGLGAGIDRGSTPVLAVGDKVQIRFDHGDTRYPVVVASALTAEEGEVELPALGIAGPRSTAGIRTTPAELPTSQTIHQSYLQDEVSQQNGILIQRRANQSYRVAHRSQGSQFEMTAGGAVVLYSPQALWCSSSAEYHERYQTHSAKGTTSVTELEGPYSIEASKLSMTSVSSMNIEAGGGASVTGLGVSLTAMDQMSLLSAGSTSMMAGSTVDIAATLGISLTSATGSITGGALLGEVVFSSAETNVFALNPLSGFSIATALCSIKGDITGGITVEGPVSSFEMSAQGTVALKNAMSELSFGISGDVELKNQMAALELSQAGQVTVKNQTGTLGEILKDLMTLLQRVTVQTGTGQSSPINQQSELQMISRRLQSLLD